MKKLFTLIELIIVIAVIGILAAIVVPNISNLQQEATNMAIASNIKNIQTSVDMYALDNNGELPVEGLTEFEPRPVDFTKLHPEQLRNLPKDKNIKYWVDAWGKVWGSHVDAPTIESTSGKKLVWKRVDGATKYRVYEIVNYQGENGLITSISNYPSLKQIEETTDLETLKVEIDKAYVVSAIDSQEFETAPVGIGYNSYTFNVNFSSDFYKSQEDAFQISISKTEEEKALLSEIVLTENITLTGIINAEEKEYIGHYSNDFKTESIYERWTYTETQTGYYADQSPTVSGHHRHADEEICGYSSAYISEKGDLILGRSKCLTYSGSNTSIYLSDDLNPNKYYQISKNYNSQQMEWGKWVKIYVTSTYTYEIKPRISKNKDNLIETFVTDINYPTNGVYQQDNYWYVRLGRLPNYQSIKLDGNNNVIFRYDIDSNTIYSNKISLGKDRKKIEFEIISEKPQGSDYKIYTSTDKINWIELNNTETLNTAEIYWKIVFILNEVGDFPIIKELKVY